MKRIGTGIEMTAVCAITGRRADRDRRERPWTTEEPREDTMTDTTDATGKHTARDNRHPWLYADSGLDDVWLFGGVEHHQTPYGPATFIRDIDALHEAIARSIVRFRCGHMNGKEFHFLRVELDLSQAALGRLLCATEQQIHRWETGKTRVPGPAQVALCGYYLESRREGRLKELMETRAELDASPLAPESRQFEARPGGWALKTAA